ncbi:hypothetical protein BDU57DRAFT_515890 [Ampelomyces quisqualis]|uniref:Uncharacterized protein n=1 Tax=Ampelomyces quisqualis TaxID=50730 RepID=A0A6A5QKV6_AMPQU|nr:hypothetical protein BDU57DRAFT_515890 [Ampelomyces quisqualis]
MNLGALRKSPLQLAPAPPAIAVNRQPSDSATCPTQTFTTTAASSSALPGDRAALLRLIMPAVLGPYEAMAAQVDSLAPRHPDHSRRNPRLSAIDHSATALDMPRKQSVAKRQQMIVQPGIIPTYYNLDGPAPGTVAGIVLGSVAGFLLIVWLLYTLFNGQTFGGARATTAMAGQEEIIVRRPRRNSHGARRSTASRRTEVREVSRSPRRSGGRSQIIVEERRGPPRPRSIIVEERHRVPNDDVVEVIEEHEDYRERRGNRRGGYR